MKRLTVFFLLALVFPSYAQWQSALVSVSDNGKLGYNKDEYGFIIPDFSHAGYMNGEEIPQVNLPDRTVVISPLADPEADNTAHIQAAVDAAGQYPPDAGGFRGVVLLNPGKYNVDGTVYLQYAGVVFRGSGRGNDPSGSTILYGRGYAGKAGNIVWMGSRKDHRWGNGNGANKTSIVTAKVMPGDYTFEVENARNYKVGDLICIKYPATEQWLQAVGYGGNTQPANYWTIGLIDISYHRYIRKIDGNRITVDAPVFYCLDKTYSQAYIYQISTSGTEDKILHHTGIENMRIEFERTLPSDTGTPDQNCVLMCSLENSWAKNLYLTGFVHAGIKTFSVTRTTIEGCSSISPSGYRDGGNHYNFENYHRSQLILVKNCRAKGGRHHFIANGGGNVSGNVALNVTSVDDEKGGISESHRLWAQGILFDNWTESNENGNAVGGFKIGMYLRRDLGSGHGWGGSNSVFWNCNVAEGGIYLDKPPTGQNYAIGCTAQAIRRYVNTSAYTTGYVENRNTPGLYPQSLYEAQLADRKNRETASLTEKQPAVHREGFAKIYVSGHREITIEPETSGRLSLYTVNGVKLKSADVDAHAVSTLNVTDTGCCIAVFSTNNTNIKKLIFIQ
jgi:hypothetical protein